MRQPTTTAPPAAAASATDRASLRTMRQRRRRVWRNAFTFLLITAVMVLLVMARRDQQDVGQCLKALRFTMQKLDAVRAEHKIAPLELPLPAQDDASIRAHYHYAPASMEKMRPGNPPIGLVCCDQPHHLFTRTDGRYVVIGEAEKLQLVWMSEVEYQHRAAELKLPARTMVVGGP